MKERLLGFVDVLRRAGIAASVSESLDAVVAVAACGVERGVLRESLAATLVKDHADRPTFDALFDRYFALPGRKRGKGERRQRAEEGEGEGRGRGMSRARSEAEGRGGEDERQRDARGDLERAEAKRARRLAARRAMLALPFRDMNPREVEEARELLDELSWRFRSRCARRRRRARRGRLDLRRTFRRAMSRGGVPIELLLRHPRPGKSDLVALVDLSYSTATAADFLLALLAPARRFFRHALLLAYVDEPVEISLEGGHVVPHKRLDMNAPSDFGRVLVRLEGGYEPALHRNTVLLVLGDARNNRRPPRADVLARLRRRVRAAVWLDPEPAERWNTGDSVIGAYARHVDAVLPAWNLRTLAAALKEFAKTAV